MISRRTMLFALAAMAVLPAFETVNAAGMGAGKGSASGGGASGKGKSQGNSGAAKGAGKATGKPKGVTGSVKPSVQQDTIPEQGLNTAMYRVRHRNGFEETLKSGRYRMQDNRGRTIVDRAAKPGDYARLRRLADW